MEEQRKHAILFGATLLCARKLIETVESDELNLRESWLRRQFADTRYSYERRNRRAQRAAVTRAMGKFALAR